MPLVFFTMSHLAAAQKAAVSLANLRGNPVHIYRLHHNGRDRYFAIEKGSTPIHKDCVLVEVVKPEAPFTPEHVVKALKRMTKND